ncbi:AI-2E family transporter [Aestuariicella hydrocarbonica]|uniref:AI-2E family transporter n=2 Tax=Pseudomaricurvus hydrocarbonicus TaxID=1470433 RepID=A0A9E5T4X5_9GAMM|nr:AI-2E family transporter [Aestuariicella hydrocarbonica]
MKLEHHKAHQAHGRMERRSFMMLLIVVSLLFLYLLKPFFSPVFWACVITILFYPLYQYLLKHWQRPNLAALTTLVVCILVGVGPTLFLLSSLVKESGELYQLIQSGQINPGEYLDKIRTGFPRVNSLLDRFGIDLSLVKEMLTKSAGTVSRWAASNTLTIGQNMLQFVVSLALMLYLLFFLLRDGPDLISLLIRALPLGDEREALLFKKFAEVTRATVKGNLVVAIIQGSLGGLIFFLLGIKGAVFWGVVMVILSLIPVVGASLIWGPVAIYLFAVGSWEKGLILTLFGAIIIGLVDNLLRPLLVGRDTKLPDYMVLLSTLGGFAIFGMNGFVIGPLVAVLFIAFWQIFILDFNTLPSERDEPDEFLE